MFLHATNACNMRCIHCCIDSSEKLKDELTTKEILNLYSNLHNLGVDYLVLTGGESLLRRDILEITKHASIIGMRVHLETHGGLLTNKILERMKQIKLASITVSLDGLYPSTHDSFRGEKGLFGKVIKRIKFGAKIGLRVVVCCVVSKYNIHEITQLPGLLSPLGVHTLIYLNFSPIGRGKFHQDLWLFPEEWRQFCRKLGDTEKEWGSSIRIRHEPCFLTAEETKAFGYGDHCSLRTRYVAHIGANGDVFPCALLMNDENFRLGNIRNEKFSSIWLESQKWDLWERRFWEDNECKKCPHRFICKSGCRAYANTYADNPWAKDPRCTGLYIPLCPCFLYPSS